MAIGHVLGDPLNGDDTAGGVEDRALGQPQAAALAGAVEDLHFVGAGAVAGPGHAQGDRPTAVDRMLCQPGLAPA